MKIGQGACRRTPWWCWAVALLGAVAVFPGAAMVISAGEIPGATPPAALPDSGPNSRESGPKPHSSAPVNPGLHAGIATGGGKTRSNTVYQQIYSVKDLLSKIQKERGLSEPVARECLAGFVRLFLGVAAGDQHPVQVLWLKDGDRLLVGATNAGHKRVADALDAVSKYGTSDQIAIETRFVALGDKLFQELLPESTMSPLNVDDAGLANSDAVEPAAFGPPFGHPRRRARGAGAIVD